MLEAAHPTRGVRNSRGLSWDLLPAICPLPWDDPGPCPVAASLGLCPALESLFLEAMSLLPGFRSPFLFTHFFRKDTRKTGLHGICMLSGCKLAVKGHSAVLWCLPHSLLSVWPAPTPSFYALLLVLRLESLLLMCGPNRAWQAQLLLLVWGTSCGPTGEASTSPCKAGRPTPTLPSPGSPSSLSCSGPGHIHVAWGAPGLVAEGGHGIRAQPAGSPGRAGAENPSVWVSSRKARAGRRLWGCPPTLG